MAAKRMVGNRVVIATEVATDAVPDTFGGAPNPDKVREFKTVERLLLDDGSEKFGCAVSWCGYVADTIRSVTSHQRTHNLPLEDMAFAKRLTVAEFLAAVRQVGKAPSIDAKEVDQLKAQVASWRTQAEEWQARAEKAEHSLSVLRAAIRGE